MARIDKKILIYLLTNQSNMYCIRRQKTTPKAILYNYFLAQDVATINYDTFLKLQIELITQNYNSNFYKLSK